MADAFSTETQFAGLVEAATAAAGQEGDWVHHGEPQSSIHPGLQAMSQQGQSTTAFPSTYTRKRKRGAGSLDLAIANTPSTPGPQQTSTSQTPTSAVPPTALFRTPSATCKKHTRPPMSKLFSSLHLCPEDFLRLQSAAKTYMLNPAYPERQNCVGQRGKSDSDMVKLKLWNCAYQFLDGERNGELFFGVNARQMDGHEGARSVTWPEDSQQIITMLLPLLRRMVTNERQRQYAIESRKANGEPKEGVRIQESAQHPIDPALQSTEEGVSPLEGLAQENVNKMDLFGDGFITSAYDLFGWYRVYNYEGDLEALRSTWGLRKDFLIVLLCNIDAHCRLYHDASQAFCDESCRTRLVQRVIDCTTYQQQSPAPDIPLIIREFFDHVLGRLEQISYWDNKPIFDSDPDSSAVESRLQVSKPATRKKIISSTSFGATNTNEKPLTSPNRIMVAICLVRQDQCVLPIVEALCSDCLTREDLWIRIVELHGREPLRKKNVMALERATLKVWLPDGLVKVEDDGQWIVSLLSAATVEWMGGQIRVLLEA